MVDRPIALAAARLVVAGKHGNALEQRRLAGAVLADDDGDGVVECELESVLQERQAERIGLRLIDQSCVKPDSLEIGRQQVYRPVSLAAHAGIQPPICLVGEELNFSWCTVP